MQGPQLSAWSFDLARVHRRTVTSFYSNLVTRPTGRAVRMGLESQLQEMASRGGRCLSILDFSQVRVMDYSCADEIVAKLLMRYAAADRPVDAYFVARGLHDHHLEAVDAVLDRHSLLLVAEVPDGAAELLGPCTATERACWSMLLDRGRADPTDFDTSDRTLHDAVAAILDRFVESRVAVRLHDGSVSPLPMIAHG